MKYEAEDVRINSEHYASVTAGRPAQDTPRSLRHARAMKAVLLAAKAWAKASVGRRAKNGFSVEYVSRCRLDRAVARLAKIEKEVSRG